MVTQPSAVVVAAAGEAGHGARLKVVAAAVEADEVAAVDVDLHRGAVVRVVHLVDLVDLWCEQRDLARLDERGAVPGEAGEIGPVAIVETLEARLLDRVAHHPDHPP